MSRAEMYSVGNMVSNYVIALSLLITCMVTSNHRAVYQELTQFCESTTLFLSALFMSFRLCRTPVAARALLQLRPAGATLQLWRAGLRSHPTESEEASAAAGHSSRAHGLNLCGAWA